ncbi:MAG: GH32 C-terminal domain-containing protein [Verrucomicrobiota bacterium]
MNWHEPTQRWVLFGADGRYVLGQFDGREFHIASGKQSLDWGPNCYAGQTFSDVPQGRWIHIAWMSSGQYPGMPFNQQMTLPCELTLKDGHLCKYPVREIAALSGKTHTWRDLTVKPGANPIAGITGELFDIEAEIALGDAHEFGFELRGQKIQYAMGAGELFCAGRCAPLPPVDGRIKLRLLLDRSSLEDFGNEGRSASTTQFLPKPDNQNLSFYSSGGTTTLVSLQVRELKPR